MISTTLRWKLSHLIAAIVSGTINTPDALAFALDELSDAVWAEIEADTAPSIRIDP